MGLHPDTQLPPEFFPRRAATIVVRASDAVDGPVAGPIQMCCQEPVVPEVTQGMSGHEGTNED